MIELNTNWLCLICAFAVAMFGAAFTTYITIYLKVCNKCREVIQ